MSKKQANNGASQTGVFVSAEAAIAAFKRGEIIILTDHKERENEGDFVVAAEFATPQAINFMITHGRGLVCMPITPERADMLKLAPQSLSNTSLMETAFTVSVDALNDTTTGISTFDRAATIRAIIDPATRPSDLGRPGHLFPLVSKPGGVIARPGHTEAVIDMARAAELYPAGVLCEIIDDDGSMARTPRLVELAKRFDLKICSVEAIIQYRQRTEKLIRNITGVRLPSTHGNFLLHYYESLIDNREYHLAMVRGTPETAEAPLVRLHSECLTGDVLGSLRCDCGEQLHEALHRIEADGQGALIYLKQEGRGIGLRSKLLAYELQEQGMDTVEANEALGFAPDPRQYWFAAQMLKDLGIHRLRLLTNNPEKVREIQKFGIEVIERLPLVIPTNPNNEGYMRTKADKMGHLLNVHIHGL